jgi:hypothetical protein
MEYRLFCKHCTYATGYIYIFLYVHMSKSFAVTHVTARLHVRISVLILASATLSYEIKQLQTSLPRDVVQYRMSMYVVRV